MLGSGFTISYFLLTATLGNRYCNNFILIGQVRKLTELEPRTAVGLEPRSVTESGTTRRPVFLTTSPYYLFSRVQCEGWILQSLSNSRFRGTGSCWFRISDGTGNGKTTHGAVYEKEAKGLHCKESDSGLNKWA